MARTGLTFLIVLVASFLSQPALAGNILFVSDTTTDTDIITVLEGDGHTVTSRLNEYNGSTRPVLEGALSGYDAVYWSTSQQNHTSADQPAFDNLSAYAASGGYVFITGADGVIDPYNPDLPPRPFLVFLGSYRGYDGGYNYLPLPNISNPLTTGRIDIRGLTPLNSADSDSICSPFSAGTTGLVQTSSSPAACNGNPSYAWALTSAGSGYIAYVQSGNFTSTNPPHDPLWTDTTMWGGDINVKNWGEYNAAARNFALNASLKPQSVPTVSEAGMILFMALAGLGSAFYAGRRKNLKG